MPNHVHVVVTPMKGFALGEILHSWKSFSAHKINELLGREGQLWQRESYDHIVRNAESLRGIERIHRGRIRRRRASRWREPLACEIRMERASGTLAPRRRLAPR